MNLAPAAGARGLLLDLSHAGFAAVFDAAGGQVLVSSARPAGTRHDDVAAWTESLLQTAGGTFSDLSWITVGVGPGSFTGIRIAMAFAQGLALPRALPVYGFTGFEALFLSAPAAPAEAVKTVAVIPANAGRFYVASGLEDTGALVTTAALQALVSSETRVIAPEPSPVLAEAVAGCAGVWTPSASDEATGGAGWDAVGIARHARVGGGVPGAAAGRGAEALRPVYLQLSAAEEKFGAADVEGATV